MPHQALTEKLAAAEADALAWAILVAHADGRQELHSGDGNALPIVAEEAVEGVREYLLDPDPVACSDAAAAGLDLLDDCERCTSSWA